MGIPNFREIREQCEAIRAQKDATFPRGIMVKVNNERFHGIGIACRDNEPLEQLALRLESGNIWWYPLEDCEPYHGLMPSWIRSYFRRNGMRRVG